MRVDFLIFSIGFDFAVQLVSRCLFFALTFWVVPLLTTSTYVCVLVSVCYPGLPATGLARSIFVIRSKNCDGPVFLFPAGLTCSVLATWPQTCRVLVFPRRFSIPLFRSSQNG